MNGKKIKKIGLVLALISITCWGYVAIINLNTKNMTVRQKILRAVYPLFTWVAGNNAKKEIKAPAQKLNPMVSFYSLGGKLIDGSPFDFNKFRGKKILIVNTASNCGYTAQYADLQHLSERYHDQVQVIGFPSNDFKEQEKGTNQEIASFCKQNYGVSFPLFQKTIVLRKEGQDPVYQWLTDAKRNGWNNEPPSWNFCKYLVSENGLLTHIFGPATSPLSEELLSAIKQ